MFTAHDEDARFRPEVAAAGPVEVQTRVDGWDFDDWGFDAAGVDMAEEAGWARHAPHGGAVSENESVDAAGVTLHDAVCRLLELDWY
jgi:hypothetical protein